jgi:hypothetical protein
MYVLVDGDQGRLTLKRLRPWHQIVARGRSARLDRELAEGARPEASVSLAARATQLTSTPFRHDLAASLRRILVAAGREEAERSSSATPAFGVSRSVRVPLGSTRVGQSAEPLAELASRLLEPGPVPVRGVAMVTELLADGTGPLYRAPSCGDGARADASARGDLTAAAARAVRALSW